MKTRGNRKMVWSRTNIDETLAAVLAEIHKTAQKPDPGFFTLNQWADKWEMVHGQGRMYVHKAMKTGILVRRNFRVITQGRLLMMAHYGPPGKPPKKKRD
jgi:hypothetical protein